ncbi:hypothetical protein NLI96_g6567 [Meripilus lineatus]|uniref:Uncharacterized protein n=1 Tax=Meripilus lineatus TaxID=2056292 RepID=A0AAD5V600_9APHY|nr:hypothetical protein NLI96_g6567 [Physisporinus lineatus]
MSTNSDHGSPMANTQQPDQTQSPATVIARGRTKAKTLTKQSNATSKARKTNKKATTGERTETSQNNPGTMESDVEAPTQLPQGGTGAGNKSPLTDNPRISNLQPNIPTHNSFQALLPESPVAVTYIEGQTSDDDTVMATLLGGTGKNTYGYTAQSKDYTKLRAAWKYSRVWTAIPAKKGMQPDDDPFASSPMPADTGAMLTTATMPTNTPPMQNSTMMDKGKDKEGTGQRETMGRQEGSVLGPPETTHGPRQRSRGQNRGQTHITEGSSPLPPRDPPA